MDKVIVIKRKNSMKFLMYMFVFNMFEAAYAFDGKSFYCPRVLQIEDLNKLLKGSAFLQNMTFIPSEPTDVLKKQLLDLEKKSASRLVKSDFSQGTLICMYHVQTTKGMSVLKIQAETPVFEND